MSDMDLPEGWTLSTVGEVAELVRGVTYSKQDASEIDEPGTVPLLRATNITDSGLDTEDRRWVPDDLVAANQELRAGDLLLVASSGSSSSVGRSALVVSDGGTFGAFCAVVRANRSAVDHRFLGRLCQSPAVRQRWSLLARGTNINNLKRDHVLDTPLYLPPLAEQKRIVAELERRLSHVDQAVRGLTRAQRQVMATRRSVLNATASGALLHLDAVGWKAVTTGDVCGVRGGIQKQPKRMPKNNPHPFLRVANVGRGNLDLAEVHEVELFGDELETYALQAGDLLVVEGNGSVDQIGRAAIWDGSIANCVHQNHLIRVRPGKAVDAHFLSLVWNAPVTVEQLRAVASSSSGLHTLSTGKIKSVRLHLPPLTDQVALVAEAQRRLSLLDAADRSISAGLSKAEQLRRSLLAAAFSGKLVPQDPSDEPAEVLLEKISAEREAAAVAAKATKTTKKPAVRKTSVRKKETQS